MDHEEVQEQLELAAVEPGGLDRLMAGDTVAAAAVVGHLAGCDACAGEFQRMARAVPLVRDVVRTTPPEDLRERTLAFVRAHGQPRGATAVELAVESSADAVATDLAAVVTDAPTRAVRGSSTSRLLPWAATIAAVVALAIAGASFVAQRDATDRVAAQAQAVAALEAVNAATLEITAGPDAERVTLAPTGVAATSGTLLFSPSTTRLVVVATDLARPPSGQEYRCWVEIDGQRMNVGRMFFADALAFWVGDTPEVRDVAAGATFGISLAEVGGTSLQADPVILGEL